MNLKIIWELLKAAPQIIGVISELIKLIRKIVGDDNDTSEGMAKASRKISKVYDLSEDDLENSKPL